MITLTLLVIFLVMLTAAIFVAKSAEARGMNAVGWGIGAFLFTIIAVPLYLIVRKPITSEIGAVQQRGNMPCSSCGKPLQPGVAFCSSCGVAHSATGPIPTSPPRPMSPAIKSVLVLAGSLVVLAIVIGIFTNGSPSITTSTRPTASNSGLLSVLTPVVTMSKFQQVDTGMTYARAVEIIGVDGEEMSRSDLAGFTTVMYGWKNPGGSNMNAMFQNGHLVMKAQFGLE